KMAESLKKPFKDSLRDIKERMKEKRNQRLVKIGQTSTVKCKRATNSSKQMKSIQANNRALAQALQEEKLKLRDAQATILYLTKECQDLKLQVFDSHRNLRFNQARGLVEHQLSALNEIISKVSQNLLDSIDLLGPAKNLCSMDAVVSGVEALQLRAKWGRNLKMLFLLYTYISNFIIYQTFQQSNVFFKFAQNLNTLLLFSFNRTFSLHLPGGTSEFDLDGMIASELKNVFSGGEDGFGNMLQKNVSTRCRYSKMRNCNELCTGVLDCSEAPDSTQEHSKQDEIGLEESLEKYAIENINSSTSQLKENKVDSEPVLRQTDPETAQLNSDCHLKQQERKSRGDSQLRKEKHQKGKLERPKNTLRQSIKKNQGKEASKEKLDFLGGSNDAYDFHFEESVHVTPFRQKKGGDTDTDVDEKEDSTETSTMETSDTEEDSDDSLYEPYKGKSKKRKSSVDKKDTSPVYTRPRSKRCLARELKLHDEKKTESNKSSDKSISKCRKCSVISFVSLRDNIECYKNHYIHSSATLFSLAEIGIKVQPSEPSRGHLCDVTNTTSLLPSTENAAVVLAGEGPRSPKRKRSCTLSVNYKEPSIIGKLRRGDPFTDTNFLSSPIFKQKKDSKCHPHRKKSLSKYNEKFVGCR
ncbi:Shugoshin-like 1, partial [Apaloderma vittatum]